MRIWIIATVAALSALLAPGRAEAEASAALEARLEASWQQRVTGPAGLAFGLDGGLLFVQNAREFTLWQSDPPARRRRFTGLYDPACPLLAPLPGLLLSRDGSLLVGAIDDKVFAWSVQAGIAMEHFAVTDSLGHVFALAWDAGGRVAVGGRDGRVEIWDLGEQAPLAGFRTYFERWGSLAFHPLGGQMAAGGAATGRSPLALFDPETGLRLRVLDGRHQRWVDRIAYSPGGSLLYAAGDAALEIWDVAAGERLQRVAGHGILGRCLALEPGGRYVATDAADGRILVLAAVSGELLADWAAHAPARVEALAFAPDGRRLASAGDEGEIKIWRLAEGR